MKGLQLQAPQLATGDEGAEGGGRAGAGGGGGGGEGEEEGGGAAKRGQEKEGFEVAIHTNLDV